MAPIRSSEITDRQVYLNRRHFLSAVAGGLGAATLLAEPAFAQAAAAHGRKLTTVKSRFSTSEPVNTWEHATTYNNFYEFGTDKADPARFARAYKPPQPWTVSVEGECAKPGRMNVEDIIKGETLEDRIYRMRCVEGWSMVIPWVGFPLANLIKRVEPTSRARFVEFTTILDKRQMLGQRSEVLEWPYVEGLRMDEALHPLTLLCVGIYGEVLPMQNGAPLRIVVPWKYGFKSAKSVVRIRFMEQQPRTSWQKAWPEAYGFYCNVNPNVDHPNHSQAVEARLPSVFRRTQTLMFNGYADQVQGLYAGMDLRRDY